MSSKVAAEMLSDSSILSTEELKARLRQVGEERYHHRHPFHLMMHEGQLSRGQLQAWALNRYYYQSIIPIKDSIVLSRSDDPDFRQFGGSAWSITMGIRISQAALSAGSSWRRRPVLNVNACCVATKCCRRRDTPWMLI